MRRALGYSILAAIFGLWFTGAALGVGVLGALLMTAAVVVLFAAIWLAVELIEGGAS